MPLTELKQGHRLTYSGNSSWTLRMGTRSFLSWSQNGNQILWSWSQNGNQTFDLDLRMGTRPLILISESEPDSYLDLRMGTRCHFHLLLTGLKYVGRERVISTEQLTQWAVQMAQSLVDCAERSHHSHQQIHASSVSVQTSPSPARQSSYNDRSHI